MRDLIAALARETIGEGQSVLSADAMRRFAFGTDKSFESLVAEQDGAIVAVVIFYDEFSTWRGEKGVYILDIYVGPSARGGGLGRRLIAAAAKCGATRGARYIRLSVDRQNARAINFYEAIGFAEGADDRVLVLSGEPFKAIRGETSEA